MPPDKRLGADRFFSSKKPLPWISEVAAPRRENVDRYLTDAVINGVDMYQTIRSLIHRPEPNSKAALENPNQKEKIAGYAKLYELHASSDDGTDVIGVGDFERIGKMELRFLELAGMHESMHVLDFGCGIGRLAEHLIPLLPQGTYTGVDISPTMIERAKQRLGTHLRHSGDNRCTVDLHVGDGGLLNTFTEESCDLACAFSVFTHMDLEDTFVHLQCLRRVLKPGGMLVCSHLLLPESADAQNIFVQSSAKPYEQRRSEVLSVVTSRQLINTIAEMAGYRVNQWIAADEQLCDRIQRPLGALGQAVSFLQRPE